MIVWLDDLRDPKDYGYPEAIWFKTYQEFKVCLYLSKYKDITEVHFDNDLGEESTQEGYHAFSRVEQSLHFGGFKELKEIYVHSSNPSAVQKFMSAKESLQSHFGIDMIRVQY